MSILSPVIRRSVEATFFRIPPGNDMKTSSRIQEAFTAIVHAADGVPDSHL